MAKSSTAFVCKHCGFESPKWLGKCPSCQQWNSFKEVTASLKGHQNKRPTMSTTSKPLPLNKISQKSGQRTSTGINEIDQVLGGGLMAGQVLLLSGEPGIGKSTLLLQLASSINLKPPRHPELGSGSIQKQILKQVQNDKGQVRDNKPIVLYISGEESLNQIKARAHRLDLKNSSLFLSNEIRVEEIINQAQEIKAKLIIVDSIQTLVSATIESTAGSLAQVRETTAQLINFAKNQGIVIFIVGQITKEGAIAGPKTLEHMVDTVLELTGERFQNLRLLRITKNRFGPIDELAVFEMREKGLVEVKNPSALFLEEITSGAAGSCVAVLMEGTRPILVEIQALTSNSSLPIPRRVGAGINANRISLISAILQRRVGLNLTNQDIFVKVSGGLKIKEPGADLAVALAIAGCLKDKPLGKVAAVGEVGLLGEIRKVARMEIRLKEARKLGFKTVISAENNKSLREVLGKLLKPKTKYQKPKTQT